MKAEGMTLSVLVGVMATGALIGAADRSYAATRRPAGASGAPMVVALLEQRIAAAGLPFHVINAGVSGQTSSEVRRRFDRAVVPGTEVLILAVGANDGLRGVPVETLRGNLEDMIQRAQQRGIHVLLVGMETPPTRGWNYTVAFHHVFPDLAAKYHLPLMPFLLSGVIGMQQYNRDDGVHPNAAGARLIADHMWAYLEPLLRAVAAEDSRH
ncbi:MAG: arylesterase [Acidobacteria bacterium]|nr:MAG: arylesterase [Acidobacteriota bacterium]